jgi:hypothetical protein
MSSLRNEPICIQCKHRMKVKMRVEGQATRSNGHSIERIGPVVEEVVQGVCKLGPIPVTNNPCVLECSEFEQIEEQPQLRKPLELAGAGKA